MSDEQSEDMDFEQAQNNKLTDMELIRNMNNIIKNQRGYQEEDEVIQVFENVDEDDELPTRTRTVVDVELDAKSDDESPQDDKIKDGGSFGSVKKSTLEDVYTEPSDPEAQIRTNTFIDHSGFSYFQTYNEQGPSTTLKPQLLRRKTQKIELLNGEIVEEEVEEESLSGEEKGDGDGLESRLG